MLKNNITIHFHDFHPSPGTKKYIDSIVSEIHQELPNGATVRATFSKNGELFKGMLQVGSFSGPLFATVVAEDLNTVTVKLIDQMRRRLEKFKSKLHSRDGLKQATKRQVYAGEEIFGKGVA